MLLWSSESTAIMISKDDVSLAILSQRFDMGPMAGGRLDV
jgi:hypothetical protein